MTESSRPRRMWALFEPIHAVTYFAPAAGAPFEAAGLRGFWRRYFAGRSAPLGPVGAAPVTAAFFGFAPGMVARALPDVWSRISPEAALAARAAGARAGLSELLAGVPPEDIAEAAELLLTGAGAADVSGRVLAAATAAVGEPGEPLDRLWYAATILREHRGDGHVIALVTAGFTGAESVVLRAALEGGGMRATMQAARGWTDEEWAAAEDRLRARGRLGTDAGRAAYAEVEQRTDALAAGPWDALGEKDTERCVTLLEPMVERLWPVLPPDNPIPLRPGRG
jgi:hypothetical protein